ncbi:flap endonuclease-1 [Thermoplasmatota archaeon]
MGVNIGGLLKTEKISFNDLKDRVIVLDAYNVIHQFLAIIRQRDGTPLKDSKGRITSHISGLLHRTGNMVESRIRPVYVFDGVPHPLKNQTLQMRKERKINAEKEWKEAIEKGDLDKAKSKAQQTSRITEEISNQSKELLRLLGIPFIQAPSEGEAQASYMVKNGDAYAVGSQDFDCLLVGSPILIRNLTSSNRRKLPGKKAYTKVNSELIRLDFNLKQLGISHKQLVDMAILIGTDFNPGVKGLGPKKSLNLIKKVGNIENAIATFGGEDAPTFEEINEIRKIFLNPNITKDYQLKWSNPNKDKVIEFLCEEFNFTKNRIEPILEKFGNIEDMMKQKTLF